MIKKTQSFVALLAICCLTFGFFIQNAEAQIILNEDFESVATPALPAGWTTATLGTDAGFTTGTDADANAGGYWPVTPHTTFAMTNDDVCNCDKSADYLILPPQNLAPYAGSGISLTAEVWSDAVYGGIGHVEVSTDGGANWTVEHVFTPTAGWQNVPVSLNSYAGMMNVWIAFRFSDAGEWGNGMAVDDVVLEAVADDLAIISEVGYEYTQTPLSQATGIDLSAELGNNGGATATNITLTAQVYLQPDLVNAVSTVNGSLTSLVAGATEVVNAGTFTPASAGDYVVVYSVSYDQSSSDANPANDMLTGGGWTITNDYYARDNGNAVGGLGINGIGAIFQGSVYDVNVNGAISAVDVSFGGGQAGDTVQIQIYEMAGDTPSVMVYSTAEIILSGAGAGWQTFNLPAPVNVNAGSSYCVGMLHYSNGVNIGLDYSDAIFTPGAAWLQIDGGTWGNPEGFGFIASYMIRPNFGVAASYDAQVVGVQGLEYTIIPEAQLSPIPLIAEAFNNGTSAMTGVTLNVEVFDGAASVFTASSAGSALATGGNVVLDAGTWTPPAGATTYSIVYTITSNEADADLSDNSATISFEVSPDTYARDNNNVVGGLGINGFGAIFQGLKYTMHNAATIGGVDISFGGGQAGDSIQVVIYEMQGDTPSVLVYTDPIVILAGAGTGYQNFTFGSGVNVDAGKDYVIGLLHYSRGVNIGLDYADAIYTPGAAWLQIGTGSWANPEDFNFLAAYLIRPIFSACPGITVATASTDEACNMANGTATVTPSGGTAPFTYIWSNGGNTATITNLSADTYLCTFTDATGCASSTSVVVGTVPNLGGGFEALSNVSCNGEGDGSVSINVSGGTMPYTYNWSNGDTSEDITGLGPDSYGCTVTDANGCTVSVGPFPVDEPDVLGATGAVTNASGGNANGAIDLSVSGGTSPFMYNWSNGATTEDVTDLAAGPYSCTVTDANGCETIFNDEVANTINSIDLNNIVNFNMYPNPASDDIQIEINLEKAMDVEVQIMQASGQVVLENNAYNISEYKKELDLETLAPGVYMVKFTIGQGVMMKRLVITK